jgi:HAD superfamily hydrolase (TIGR01459 family)
MTAKDIPLIPGLSALADRYDALLCDVWGVLHDGQKAYPGVESALTKFRAKGGTVLLLSNAPRPSNVLPQMFAGMGLGNSAYDGILTSGDATREYLMPLPLGRKCYYIGPSRDHVLLKGLDLDMVEADEADFVLIVGPFNDEVEGPEDYRTSFTDIVARGLPLVCANPDIMVERGEKRIYCAGALAQLYERLGGKVIYFGKPHGPIYDVAKMRLSQLAGRSIANDRILAVGDGLLTDIRGAADQSINALFVTGGLSAPDVGPTPEQPDPDRVNALCSSLGLAPVAALPRLIW